MYKLLKIMLLVIMSIPSQAQLQFKNDQLKFERVKNAYDEKWPALQNDLQKAGFEGNFQLYIAAYKSEGKVELWLKTIAQKKYKLFRTYDFCSHSGNLGPKVVEGDGQTPEGFYKINVFNPQSSYHLSLGIDYPNRVDVARTGKGNKPGSDIYIHGNCVTIGCIPLTDEKIKEVYIIAVEARNSGQKEIPIHIFPFKMTEHKMRQFGTQFPVQMGFWKSLQVGYAEFERNRLLPKITQIKGDYEVKL